MTRIQFAEMAVIRIGKIATIVFRYGRRNREKSVGSIVMARDGVGARLIRATTNPFPFGSGVQQPPL